MNEKYDNTNRGSFFKNDKQGNENRPDFTGKLNVEGKEYRLSGWKKVSAKGVSYLSLSISDAAPVSTPVDDF